MSISSQIQGKDIFSLHVSPRKSLNMTTSPHLTPRSGFYQNSDDDSQILEREQLLKLEIRQIKRENQFLKKKIKQLLSQRDGDRPKKKPMKKGIPRQNKDPIHLTIQFFFQQINNLLNSLMNLYKIEFTSEQIEKYKNITAEQISNITEDPLRSYTVYKKFNLNRSLNHIFLQAEDKRYLSVIDIFSTFYRSKEECDIYIKKYVDKMIDKTQQLNKLILDKVQKKTQLKSSRIKTYQSLGHNSDHVDDNPQTKDNLISSSNIGKIQCSIINQFKRRNRISAKYQQP